MEKREVHLATVFRFVISYEGKSVAGSIPKNDIIIGRTTSETAPDIDLSADINVSRRHARIICENSNYWIEDLGSKLGTQVNGVEIKDGGKRPLPAGALVNIGNTTLRVTATDAVSGFLTMPTGKPLETVTGKILAADLPGNQLLAEMFSPVFEQQARLMDLPLEFLGASDLHDLLKLILQRTFEFAPQGTASALLLQNRKEESMHLAAFSSEPVVTESLARRALGKGDAFIWKAEPTEAQKIVTGGICVPLIWKENKLGVIALSGLAADFSPTHLVPLTLLARYAACALNRFL